METKSRTDFLFPKRSLFTGFSSIFNVSGETTNFNTSKSGEEADVKAIRSDWEMVGIDFEEALKKIKAR